MALDLLAPRNPSLDVAVVDNRPQAFNQGEFRAMSVTSDGRLRVDVTSSPRYMILFGDTGPLATDPTAIDIFTSNPLGT